MLPIPSLKLNKLLLVLSLFLLSVLGDYYSAPMLYGLKYHFSSVFLIVALFLIGSPGAIVLSAGVAWCNYSLLQMPIFDSWVVVAEMLFLAGFLRLRRASVFLYDLIFWFIAGMCLLAGASWIPGAGTYSDLLLHIVKYIVNGAANALAAEVLLTYLPLLPWSFFRRRRRKITLQLILVHLSVSVLVVPFVCFMIVTGISQNHMVNLRALQLTTSTAAAIQEQLADWGAAEYRALALQDVTQLGKLQDLVVKSALPPVQAVITDPDGSVLANSLDSKGAGWDWRSGGKLYRYSDSLHLWLPGERPLIELSSWRQGFYFHEANYNRGPGLQIFVKLPSTYLLSEAYEIYTIDFTLILVFILLVLLAVQWLSRSIVGMLVKLTDETTGLPDKLTAQLEIAVQATHITEFDRLHENFRLMALKLKRMFTEAIELNTVLKEQAARIKQSEEQFQLLAYTDALTQIPNRLYFHSYFRGLLVEPGITGALMFMDLNKFKHINDTYGHEAGDALLQHTAGLLKEAAGDGTVCRLGGDEFVLILPAADTRHIEQTAADIMRRFESPLEFHGILLQPRTSIGIARFPQDANAPEELLYLADQAMYRAKQRGSGVEWYCHPAEPGGELH